VGDEFDAALEQFAGGAAERVLQDQQVGRHGGVAIVGVAAGEHEAHAGLLHPVGGDEFEDLIAQFRPGHRRFEVQQLSRAQKTREIILDKHRLAPAHQKIVENAVPTKNREIVDPQGRLRYRRHPAVYIAVLNHI
jgi:hypothetical protein